MSLLRLLLAALPGHMSMCPTCMDCSAPRCPARLELTGVAWIRVTDIAFLKKGSILEACQKLNYPERMRHDLRYLDMICTQIINAPVLTR